MHAEAQAAGRLRSWRGWPVLRRTVLGLLFLAVAALLVRHAHEVDWGAVAAVMRRYEVSTLLPAAGLAAGSHALYSCFDVIGRRQTGHRLPTGRVMATAFVSYAFNLNLGALVGGVALRYRLYARQGLAAGTITQVLALSLASNWLGYLVLAGGAFIAFPLALPAGWPVGAGTLRLIGLLLLALAAAYLLTCFVTQGRVWQVRGHRFTWPSGAMGLLQLAISAANWALIAGVVAVLLQGRPDYPSVLGVLLIAAVAGVVAHVPAGLGVLEAVFIALLSHRVAQAELIGALLAYRAIYYLVPLGLALVIYLVLETQVRAANTNGVPQKKI